MSKYNNIKIRYTNIHGINNIRLAFISDVHINKDVNINILNNITDIIKTNSPEYIIIGGDLIDSPKVLDDKKLVDITKNFLKGLGEITKTFIILGNHDIMLVKKGIEAYNKEFFNSLIKIPNIYLLDNNSYLDNKIYIMGYSLDFKYYHNSTHKEDLDEFYIGLKSNPRLYKNIPDGVIKVGVIHSPKILESSKNRELLSNFDLVLCGHYHNGCVPYFLDDDDTNGIIDPEKKLFPKYARGYKEYGNLKVITSGGLTTISRASGFLLRPLNNLTYRHMDIITFNKNIGKTIINSEIKKL